MSGPLSGIEIVEFAGLGPAPFCGMMLADQGAHVLVVHKPGAAPDPRDPLARSRELLEIDLKQDSGITEVRNIVRDADGVIEGFRPGVMERLGLGPDVLLGDNPRLVFGRMTGWGQSGPLYQAAGHDINFIALAGVLHACGRVGEKPTPPINLLGDFGGGGMLLAFGMVCALLNAKRTGVGQVIDCAMTEGAALLMSMAWGHRVTAGWKDERGTNLLDTGAPFYECYETADGGFISIGAIEAHFYVQLLSRLGLSESELPDRTNPAHWPELGHRFTEIFRTRTRDEWCALLQGSDACFAPVLSMDEATKHPHNLARNLFIELDGVIQPGPAPRYSGTPNSPPRRPKAAAGD